MKTKKRGSSWTAEQRRKFKATMKAKRGKPAPQVSSVEFPLEAIPQRPKPVPELMRKLTRANKLEQENKLLRDLVQHYMKV